MHFNHSADLSPSFPCNTLLVDRVLALEPALMFLSMSNGDGNSNEATRPQSAPAIATVAQALELARDSPDGAQDSTVVAILEAALTGIWRKVVAQPASYVMTRDEFAVFNYFQDRFVGQELAIAARKRYWDHLQLTNGA